MVAAACHLNSIVFSNENDCDPDNDELRVERVGPVIDETTPPGSDTSGGASYDTSDTSDTCDTSGGASSQGASSQSAFQSWLLAPAAAGGAGNLNCTGLRMVRGDFGQCRKLLV